MMANSGARGSFKQIRQLAGMRGLMANPKGEIIERPIKANFMEGLSVLEYFISTHGARKGLADTALRTADSGYLTRRLVDVSQDVIIREDDCGTEQSIECRCSTAADARTGRSSAACWPRRSRDRTARDKSSPKGSAAQRARSTPVCSRSYDEASDLRLPRALGAQVRGRGRRLPELLRLQVLATGEMSEIGDAVGIIAAQSIGEPGTQLTMRTFHTGGVAGADITHGLPRVVELFEARKPKGAAVLAEVAGRVARRGHRARRQDHGHARRAGERRRGGRRGARTSCRGGRACSCARATGWSAGSRSTRAR